MSRRAIASCVRAARGRRHVAKNTKFRTGHATRRTARRGVRPQSKNTVRVVKESYPQGKTQARRTAQWNTCGILRLPNWQTSSTPLSRSRLINTAALLSASAVGAGKEKGIGKNENGRCGACGCVNGFCMQAGRRHRKYALYLRTLLLPAAFCGHNARLEDCWRYWLVLQSCKGGSERSMVLSIRYVVGQRTPTSFAGTFRAFRPRVGWSSM